MSNIEPWEELVEAEKSYIAKRMALYAAGAQAQLSLALGSPRGREAALRVLLDSPVELVIDLFEDIFPFAITTNPQVGLARTVIGRVDKSWLDVSLPPMISSRLDEPEIAWDDYRRMAEFLYGLKQSGLLSDLVRRAAASDDADIREVAEDFAQLGDGPA